MNRISKPWTPMTPLVTQKMCTPQLQKSHSASKMLPNLKYRSRSLFPKDFFNVENQIKKNMEVHHNLEKKS